VYISFTVFSSIDRTLQENRELDLEFCNMLRRRSDAYSAEFKSDDGGYRVYNDEDIESKHDVNTSAKRKEPSPEQWKGTYS
jgi:hypothetical protein